VDDIIQELTKLASELDTVKFFGWYAYNVMWSSSLHSLICAVKVNITSQIPSFQVEVKIKIQGSALQFT
jgi:hypothetical protein